MNTNKLSPHDMVVLQKNNLQQLIDVLIQKGYQVMGPAIRDNSVVYDEITAVSDMPEGWTDRQDGGVYRLEKRSDKAIFGYVNAPESWKKFLFPSKVRLWQAKRNSEGFQILDEPQDIPRYAFIGVRACEIQAIEVQDRVFKEQSSVDPTYSLRRDNALIIAVNCGQAGGTCFCDSMKTGPKVTGGFDIAMTEIIDHENHMFLAEVGTDLGASVLENIPWIKAEPEIVEQGRCISEQAAAQMGRNMDTTEIKELLYKNYEHPRWNDVAERCLTCGNCTLVCPTCFCTTVEDRTDISGESAERRRVLDSCYNLNFSYIHGGTIRSSGLSRYRQWMTHKLAAWIDQFGVSGCVGCGRCITWCPVGIDITEEVKAIRDNPQKGENS